MNFGLKRDKFFIEFKSCQRRIYNLRKESEIRARSLAENYGGNFYIGTSGGVDSQIIIHSFVKQNIPFETFFIFMPGLNNNELEQVKHIDKKYGLNSHIIDIDPYKVKDEIMSLSQELDIPGRYHLLQRKAISLLPKKSNIVQNVHDTFVYVNPKTEEMFYRVGYYFPETMRIRAIKSLKRQGDFISFGDNEYFLLSLINDKVYRAALKSRKYFDGNELSHPVMKHLNSLDRWDTYIKPILYAMYWGDELTYFPKYHGYEKIDYLQGDANDPKFRNKSMYIPYKDLLKFLKQSKEPIKRFYSND